MEIQLNTHSIHYEVISPNEVQHSSILVFLHEALGSIGQWKSFPKLLCEQLGMKGIMYERQGHGNSSSFSTQRTAHYLHDYALKELPAFIEQAIPNENVILVGHSDGGTIALLYSNCYPKNILGVVTLAAHVVNEPETIAGIAPAINAYRQGKLDGLKKYHGEKTEQLFFAWANIWRDESFKNWDITKEIEQRTIPGLFLQGADDQYGTIKQLELIQENYTRCEIIEVKNCGHHPHLEQQQEVLSVISQTVNQWISS